MHQSFPREKLPPGELGTDLQQHCLDDFAPFSRANSARLLMRGHIWYYCIRARYHTPSHFQTQTLGMSQPAPESPRRMEVAAVGVADPFASPMRGSGAEPTMAQWTNHHK